MTTKLRRSASADSSSDAGASAVEYAIIVSLVAVVIVAAVFVFGGKVQSLFDRGANCVQTPTASC